MYPFEVNKRKNKNTEIFKHLKMFIFANLSSDIQTNYLIILKKSYYKFKLPQLMQELKFIFHDLNKSNSGIKSLNDFLEESGKLGYINAYNNNFEKTLIIYDTLLQDQKLLTSNFYSDFACHAISALPLENISLQLQRNGRYDYVKDLHILAHGSQNGIYFAGELIDEKTLIANADILKSWNIENLFLWSCEIGKNKNLISLFSELTGANVFSSKEKISRDKPYIFDKDGNEFNINQIVDPKAVQKWKFNVPHYAHL